MARSTESRMKSEVGETREAKIGTMLAAGFSAESIQQALEAEYTETMPADDPRRKKLKNAKPFDKLARQRQLEAIRSTRRIMLNQDKDTDEWVQVLSTGSEMGSIDNTEMSNIRRFSCGMPSIDFVYGSSAFIWLKDHNEKHPEKGRYRRGDFMPRWVPQSIIDRGWVEDEKLPDNKPWVAETEKEAYAEHGMPHAFLSIWPGSPGVGKSRLAIAVTKTMNELDNLVLYYNGEAERSQFRTWCGHDANPDLFMVSHAEMIRLDQIVRDCYKYKPRAVIIDSLQMIAEVDKGMRGTVTTLSRLKLLKNEEEAGKPHIIFISQLNKKGDIGGTKKIPHMCDFAAKVTRVEGRSDVFEFGCPEKNRGGPTGRLRSFRHLSRGIQSLSAEDSRGPLFKLLQDAHPEVAATVQPVQPVDTGLDDGDDGDGE